MLVKEMLMALTCIIFCNGSLEGNASVNKMIKKLHEDNQSNSGGRPQNTKNEETKSRKEDISNLRVDDITRPISQNIPNIKNLVSSIPLPVQLLLRDNNQNQHTDGDLDKSNEITNNNNGDTIVPTTKHRPIKKKIKKINDDNNENIESIDNSRPQSTNKKEINSPRNLVLENKLNNRYINKEKIISPEDYNKEHLFDEAIIPLLKVLENFKFKEVDKTNSDNKQKVVENRVPEVQKLSKNLDSTKELQAINDDQPAEKVTKILEEQNILLKDILFKTLNYKNETNKDNQEKEAKIVHLILDIHNPEVKENDNPKNTIQKRNNIEEVLSMILYRKQNNTQEKINKSKNESKKVSLEESSKQLRNDTNQYIYFNNRNIRTYIYSINGKKNQPVRRSHYKTYNPIQYPITGVDWNKSNDMGYNRKTNDVRIYFVPSREEMTDVPSNDNYELYKKYKSRQFNPYALQGIKYRKFISKCPYHGLYRM